MDGSVLEEKSSFKMLGLTFSSKLDWDSYIISIAKTVSKKIGALIHSMKFFLLRLLFQPWGCFGKKLHLMFLVVPNIFSLDLGLL